MKLEIIKYQSGIWRQTGFFSPLVSYASILVPPHTPPHLLNKNWYNAFGQKLSKCDHHVSNPDCFVAVLTFLTISFNKVEHKFLHASESNLKILFRIERPMKYLLKSLKYVFSNFDHFSLSIEMPKI